MKLILADNCNCPSNTPNYTNKAKAIAAFQTCELNDKYLGSMFWAVHFDGKHILNITEDDHAD